MLQVSFSARAKEDKRCLSRLDFFRIFELLLNLVVKLLKLFFQDSKVGIREVLKMYEPIACGGDRPYQFVKFQLHGLGITVLRVLNQKDHKEGYDCRSRVDHELPCIRVVERRASCRPSRESLPSRAGMPMAIRQPKQRRGRTF